MSLLNKGDFGEFSVNTVSPKRREAPFRAQARGEGY